jgi:hypothetical protein
MCWCSGGAQEKEREREREFNVRVLDGTACVFVWRGGRV